MVKLLTGNELLGGHVLWWGSQGWSADIADAAGLDADNGAALMAREQEAARVNDLALVDAEEVDGRLRPIKIRERIRGFGPTVRPEFGRTERDYR